MVTLFGACDCTRWCPRSFAKFVYSSNFTQIYGRYIYINQLINPMVDISINSNK